MAVDVGLMIKKKRKEKGISQQQLSKLSGISQSAISDIENPEVTKKPNTDTITKLANALGCGVSELLEESTIDEPIYSFVEKNLIDDFRSLSRPGKEYILQTMAMAVITYAEKSPSPSRCGRGGMNKEAQHEKENPCGCYSVRFVLHFCHGCVRLEQSPGDTGRLYR